MNKKLNVLKKLGEKAADTSMQAECIPFFLYQPKPPAKLVEKTLKSK